MGRIKDRSGGIYEFFFLYFSLFLFTKNALFATERGLINSID